MPQSLAKIYTHLVFSTKHRRNLIDDQIRKKIHSYMAGILNKHGCPCLLINSMPDHVHILFVLSRTMSISDVVKEVKSGSTMHIHEEFPDRLDFYWQAGYGAFSVSQSDIERVSEYINNQEQHHKKFQFQDEFRTLLQKYEIEYDEQYVWD